MRIRAALRSDLPELKLIVEDTGLFPVEALDDMISEYLELASSHEQWLVCDTSEDGVVGFAYFRPEPLTDGVWNLLAMGFKSVQRGQGFGHMLVSSIENTIQGARILIVETSSLEEFEGTQAFYQQCGFEQEAVIRDYWSHGDDKVIFRKLLS